jgi:predicted porin
MTDDSQPLSLKVTAKIGGFFGGDRTQLTPSIQYRVGETFNATLDWAYNDIQRPGNPETLKINVGSLRATYSFSPRVSLQALVQYNDATDTVASNIRLSWLTSADAGFYLVYNETRDDDVGMFTEKRREWIVKFSHSFDVFDR